MSKIELSNVQFLNGFDPQAPELQKEVTVSIGRSSTAKSFKPVPTLVGGVLGVFTVHTEGEKDGVCYTLADQVAGPRLATSVQNIPFIGLDHDTGVPIEQIRDAYVSANLIGAVSTTYSNGKTETLVSKDALRRLARSSGVDDQITLDLVRSHMASKMELWLLDTVTIRGEVHNSEGIMVVLDHAPWPKARGILPLQEKFVIADYGGTMDAKPVWAAIVRATSALIGIPHDPATEDLARVFFPPRHKKGSSYQSFLIGGSMLNWKTLDLAPHIPSAQARQGRGPATAGGKKLVPWFKKDGHAWEPAKAIEAYSPDRIRNHASAGFEVECPNDHLHSNAGDPDDRACLVMDAGMGDYSTAWVWKCQHASCANMTGLDMCAAALAADYFPEDALTDPGFFAIELPAAPDLEAAGALIAKAKADRTTRNMKVLMRDALAMGLEELEQATLLRDLRKAFGAEAATFNRVFKEVRKGMAAGPAAAHQPASQAASDFIGRFPPPPSVFAVFHYESWNGRLWLYGKFGDAEAERLWTPWSCKSGMVAVDRGNARGLRIEVLDPDGATQAVDLGIDEAFAANGNPLKIKLAEAGVGMTPEGEAFLLKVVRQNVPANAIQIYDRPGWRGPGLFITPTGEATNTNQEVELAEGIRFEDAEFGTLEGWIEATLAAWKSGVLQFKIAALVAFGSPIIDLCGQDSPWVALTGKTTKGKTTAAKLMATVWGNPQPSKGVFGTLNGTQNSVEARLAQGSGAGYAFDETNLTGGEVLQTLIFKGSGGAGKDRLLRNSKMAQGRAWKGVFVLTGEHDLLRKIKSSGAATTTGIGTRVLEVNCEDTPELEAPVISAILKAMENYGHAGKVYIRRFIDEGLHLNPAALWKEVEAKAIVLAGEGAEPALIRAARIPAVLWQAGEIAQRAGLVPQDHDIPHGAGLTSTIGLLWERGLESDIAPSVSDDLAISAIFEKLLRNRGGRVGTIGKQLDDTFAGSTPKDAWRLDHFKGEVDNPVYVILKSSLSEYADGALNAKALGKLLRARDYLIPYLHGQDQRNFWPYVAGIGKIDAIVIKASAVEDEAVPKNTETSDADPNGSE